MNFVPIEIKYKNILKFVLGLDQEAFLEKYKTLKQILKAKDQQIEVLEIEKEYILNFCFN